MVVKLGVLGGMGPLATVDFLRKLVAATPAATDQEHVPTLVYSACQTPDRTAAILGKGASPLDELLAGVRLLERAGAGCIVMPCNTAHHWHAELAAATTVPIPHIVDVACDGIDGDCAKGTTVGVLATQGTLRSGVYQQRIAARGHICIVPEPTEQEEFVTQAIAMVKGSDIDGARRLLRCAVDRLKRRGADRIILGCTEIPVAMQATEDDRLVDATDALARHCVDWWLDRREVGQRPGADLAPARAGAREAGGRSLS